MKNNSFLYMQIYDYYKELIVSGKLKSGTRLPSVRRCSELQGVSKTTVEQAYMYLCDDGYLIPKNQSGYYVSDKGETEKEYSENKENELKRDVYISDYTSTGVDFDVFDLSIWTRYVKRSLRQDSRLMDYGDPQGELDLRREIADYIRQSRSCVCDSEDIVIGAGAQTLLNLLCALMNNKPKSIYFNDLSYRQGVAVFEDRGYKVLENKDNADIIYLSPSHTSRWGDIMSVSERHEYVKFARKNNKLIIEDDYDSEFRDMSSPTPSLQGLDSETVVYLGTFSKLLLPSIRISYMILPKNLMKEYRKISYLYNQTVSVPDQMALEGFISDGRLSAQIRKAKKVYSQKSKLVEHELKLNFKNDVKIERSRTPLYVHCKIKAKIKLEELTKRLETGDRQIKIIPIKNGENYIEIAFSVSSIQYSNIKNDISEIFHKINSN